MKLLGAGERILLTVWVGGMWAIGYMAVPSLFATLDDRQLAGQLAGNMFTIIYVIGLACAAALLVFSGIHYGSRVLRRWRFWVLAGAALVLAVSYFGIQPAMQDLKAQGLIAGSAQAARFGMLHGVSSVLYLAASVAGLVLVIFGLHDNRSTEPNAQAREVPLQ